MSKVMSAIPGNERLFKNKHTNESGILLRIETLNDNKSTRVYVYNVNNASEAERWEERLFWEHHVEVTAS